MYVVNNFLKNEKAMNKITERHENMVFSHYGSECVYALTFNRILCDKLD